jgi:hypothetical protein
MNERIKKLMGQALDEKFAGTWSVMDMQDLEKFADRFAELIVRKCAEVAWYHTPDWEELEYSHLIEDKILKHFGVEE